MLIDELTNAVQSAETADELKAIVTALAIVTVRAITKFETKFPDAYTEWENEDPIQCAACSAVIMSDGKCWYDDTGGDACGDSVHQPAELDTSV